MWQVKCGVSFLATMTCEAYITPISFSLAARRPSTWNRAGPKGKRRVYLDRLSREGPRGHRFVGASLQVFCVTDKEIIAN